MNNNPDIIISFPLTNYFKLLKKMVSHYVAEVGEVGCVHRCLGFDAPLRLRSSV